MRNLKRVLSLALATVMLLGMMVIGAGAADTKVTYDKITDKKDIVNTEAVALMVDLGIIVGKPDGTYAPKEAVDRATMAKLIYFVLMGGTDESSFKGVSTPLTDIKGNWAEGFINYCYSMKIVAGVGDNTFNPSGKVTVASAAKMLLVALGYDAKLSKYEGDAMWSVNIMRDAQKAGLLEKIDQKSGDELTRDNAAQMIFNALFAKTVTPLTERDQGVQYLTKYEPTGSSLAVDNYKLYKVTAPVEGIDGKGKAVLTTASIKSGSMSVSGATLTGTLPGTPNMVGSSVSIYVKGTVSGGTLTVTSVYSTVPVVSASNVLATNSGLKGTGLAAVTGVDALTALLVTEKTKVASLESGKAVSDLILYYNGAKDTSKTNIGKIGAYGVVTELKNTNETAGVDTVVVTEKKVTTLTATPVVSGTTVTISSLAIANVDTSKVIGYEGLVKGDVVLYVQMGGMTYIEKAAMVEGVASGSHNTKGMLLDSNYYLTSALAGKTNEWSNDFANTYKFYLDNGKNIVKAVKVTDEKSAGSYTVLSNIALVKTSGVNGTHYVEAKIVKADGTVEVVKVASVDGAKVVLKDAKLAASAEAKLYSYAPSTVTAHDSEVTAVTKTFYYTNPKSTDVTAKYFAASESGDLTTASNNICTTTGAGAATGAAYAVLGQVYEYTVNSDGEYVLSTKLTKASYAQLTAAPIKNNKATFNGSNIGNSETVFLYESKDGNGKAVYTVYTGIANVPTTAKDIKNPTQNTVVVNNSGVATFVYAKIDGTAAASKDLVYIYDKDNFTTVKSGNTEYYIYDAVVNGVNASVKLSAKPAAVGLYPVESVNDKEVKTLLAALSTEKTTGVISTSGGSLITGTTTAKAYTYADADIFYVNGKNVASTVAGDALALNAYDTVYVIETSTGSGVAKVIYVIHEAPALKNLTITAASPMSATDGELADGKGEVTGWAANTNTITVTVTTGKDKTEVVADTITINDAPVALNATYAVAATGTYTIKVLVTDKCSGAQDVITATLTVK